MTDRPFHNLAISMLTGWNPRIAIALSAIVMLCLTGAIARVAQVDVTGTWEMTVETKEGTAKPTITLKQEGEKLSGTYRGRMGSSQLQGTLKATGIRFVVNLKFQDVEIEVTYSGTVTGDAMKGTARFGDAGAGTWSAKRKQGGSDAASKSSTWE